MLWIIPMYCSTCTLFTLFNLPSKRLEFQKCVGFHLSLDGLSGQNARQEANCFKAMLAGFHHLWEFWKVALQNFAKIKKNTAKHSATFEGIFSLKSQQKGTPIELDQVSEEVGSSNKCEPPFS